MSSAVSSPAIPSWSLVYEVCFDGVDFSLPGNGGPDCLASASLKQRVAETVLSVIICIAALIWVKKLKRTHRDEDVLKGREFGHSCLSANRKRLLVLFTFVFSLEIGYKFSTRQTSFLLNPCHLLSFVNIWLLAATPTHTSRKVLRFVLSVMHGPALALVFPVTNTLKLPCEVQTYWAQHWLLVSAPIFLLLTVEEYRSLRLMHLENLLMSYAFWVLLHLVFLHWFGVFTLVNVGSVLCPPITDPFYGPWHRMHGLWHQGVLLVASAAFATSVRVLATWVGLCSDVITKDNNDVRGGKGERVTELNGSAVRENNNADGIKNKND